MSEVVKKPPPDTLDNSLHELTARVRVALHQNRHRDTLRRASVPQILREVLKGIARILNPNTPRDVVLKEISDCGAFLAMAFHRRKQPHGER